MSNKSSVSSQVISLPKGGGAVKGIGETFQPNLFSGTGNHSIPIALSPGRNGFGPALSLQYSSGNGNGPFGLGWQLSIPRITRKTERGLPQQVYGARVTDSMLGTDGGYVHSEGDDNWWITSGLAFYSPNVADSPAQELAFAQQHFFLPHRARDPFGNTAFVTYDPYDFQPKQTIDPLGNRTTAEHNYRLLQPFRLTDPNGNRAEVAFDTLGLVAGTAVMGRAPETKGDSLVEFVGDLTPQQRQDFLADPLGHAPLLLGHATTRILYDLDRYLTLQQPVFAATIARQTHTSDPLPPSELKFHVSLGYSDGFGREIQKKIQAEPGPVVDGGPTIAPRWVGSGWTIFNNKGKPIKQYEPFFDDTHAFWFANQVGVSSTLFYDPIERVVATLHPDYTWEKVVFNPWRQETWDVNDTVLIADPKNDPDVGEFFQRLADSDYLPTWHTQRHGGGLGALEQAAAAKTEVHAATPSIVYADSLGRTFLTVAHNRFERNGTMLEEKYATRVDLDIEGNQRKVIDAKDRVVMRYDYDMLGTRIHLASMEAGQRWMLNDVAGRPIYAWNSRDHRLRTTYDALRRPAESYLHEGTGSELMIGRTLYGESRPDAEGKNQRGKVIQLFDQAGVVTSDDYDFKGNLLSRGRQLARDYTTTLDWSTNPELEPETFTGSTTYYALNRPLTATSPDGSVYRPTFNEANLLERLEVNLRGAPTATPFVTDINYDAKGQRVLIEYGNSVRTNYDYGPLTFRLTRLKTVRGAKRLQGLHYTYDPAGNIAHIQDNAQQTIYFNNQAVSPNNDYTYDAVYRLITAKGREHIGQASQPRTTWDDQFRVHLPHPGDGQAMRRYTEFYEYDAVGNFLQLIHQAVSGNWTRGYTYNEPSLIDPGKNCNRLSSTTVGGNSPETYAYDAHGNMTAMPHLSLMQWDYRDQLQATSRQVVTDGSRETTWYVYDAGGQRVRKITERQNGTRKNERTYLGGFEVYREYDGNGAHVTLERETLHVMDDKQRIALIETKTLEVASPLTPPASLIRYQCGNHLGSANLELDDTAQIISYEEYYSYGSTSFQAGRNASEVSLKRYRYTGKERDKETGFSYHGARYYVPWLAVWVSCDAGSFDPLRQILTSSYAAFALSPVQYDDPDGASPEKPPRSKAPSGWERFKDKARRALFILGTILKDDPNPIPPPAEPGGGLERQKKKQADADQEERAREKNKSKAAGSSPPPNGPEPEPPGGSRSSSGGSSGQADHITEQQLGGRTASKTNRPGGVSSSGVTTGGGSSNMKAPGETTGRVALTQEIGNLAKVQGASVKGGEFVTVGGRLYTGVAVAGGIFLLTRSPRSVA